MSTIITDDQRKAITDLCFARLSHGYKPERIDDYTIRIDDFTLTVGEETARVEGPHRGGRLSRCHEIRQSLNYVVWRATCETFPL